MKLCIKCKEEKELNKFYKNKNLKDGYQNYCKICKDKIDKKSLTPEKQRQFNAIRIKRTQNKLLELKLKHGGKCNKCSESRYHVLEFHHIDPSKKIDQINNLIGFYGKKNWHIAENEANKCILLCSNCHKDFHFFEFNNKITIKQYLDMAER